MRRSKLEIHVDILKALAFHGRLKPTHIMYKANVNGGLLKRCLDLLIQQNLVEECILNKKRHKTRVVYTITGRGLKALRNVREINNALKIIEEENVLSVDLLSKSQSFSKQDFH